MSEIKSLGYWVGHFFTIVATVVGVYLAATAGFNAALKLELLQSDRDTYYLTESIYKEMRFNINSMDHYLDNIKDKRNVFREHIAGIRLNRFVLDAAKYSSSTFEIEPQLLTEISAYYFTIGSAIDDYYKSGKGSPSTLMSIVKRENKKLAVQGSMKRLADYKNALAQSLQKRGVSVIQGTLQ